MMDRNQAAVLVTLMGLLANPGSTKVLAGDHANQTSNQASPHTIKQAGYPYCVSSVARPSYDSRYEGGYVGGGSILGGHERGQQEGTWGWDYKGPLHRKPNVFLGWSHGRRAQGGTGSYATDGPHPLRHLSESIHPGHRSP